MEAPAAAIKYAVADQRDKRWFVVPTDLVDRYLKRLTPEAFALFIVLKRRIEAGGDAVTYMELAMLMGVPVERILRIVAELSRQGLLVVEDVDGELFWTIDVPEEVTV